MINVSIYLYSTYPAAVLTDPPKRLDGDEAGGILGPMDKESGGGSSCDQISAAMKKSASVDAAKWV
jgi:hypothetical protein